MGWPIRRPRRLTAMVRKDKWCCSASQEEFLSFFGREPSLTGSDLLCCDPATVQEYMCKKMRSKNLFSNGQAVNPKDTCTIAQRHRLEDCLAEQQRKADKAEDWVMDVTQSLDWTSVTQYAPCLLRGSLCLVLTYALLTLLLCLM